jgi:soluble lytic murein transglycosylase-like protein
MLIRVAAIGFGVLASLAGAAAQDTRPQTPAAVDASGHVLPLGAAPVSVERIGAAQVSQVASPCPDAVAMVPEEARALVTRIATEEAFYPDFVQSVAKAESQFNSVALSDKGAFGVMQLEPETAQRFKVDLCDPVENIRGGIRFLRALHEKYRNPLFILAAYNAGEGAVEQSRGVPPYPETVRFVAQVLNDFYAWPALGPAAARGPLRSASRTLEAPDLIEPREATAPPKTPKPAPKGRTRWDDGFVMHVD